MRKWILTIIIFITILTLIACNKDDPIDKENGSEGFVITDDEKFPEDEIIVTINDVDLNGKTYNQMYFQIKKLTYDTNVDENPTANELKALTIDSMIDQELFIQLAEQKGIHIRDEIIAEKLKDMQKVNVVGYEKMREQFNNIDTAIERQLKYELSRREYINQYVQVDVTDEETETTYNELKEQIDEIQSLDTIKDELKQTIEIQKIDKKLNDIVTKFKKDSEIEINI